MKSKTTRPRGSHFILPDKTVATELISGNAVQGSGVNADRDQLILDHLHLAKTIAAHIYKNLVDTNIQVHIQLSDLTHAGVLGLFDAVKRYEPAKQIPFSVYARHRIRGVILDSLRQLEWAWGEIRRRHCRAAVDLKSTRKPQVSDHNR